MSIYLNNNAITAVASSVFSRLGSLKRVELQGNQLKGLDREALTLPYSGTDTHSQNWRNIKVSSDKTEFFTDFTGTKVYTSISVILRYIDIKKSSFSGIPGVYNSV